MKRKQVQPRCRIVPSLQVYQEEREMRVERFSGNNTTVWIMSERTSLDRKGLVLRSLLKVTGLAMPPISFVAFSICFDVLSLVN